MGVQAIDAPLIDGHAVARAAAALWLIDPVLLAGAGRDSLTVRARFALCWALHTATAELRAETGVPSAGLSLAAIGRLLGRDHTTIIHAVDQAERLRADQPIFRRFSDQLLDVARNARTDTPQGALLADVRHPAVLTRRVKPKNEAAQGDSDARMRMHGTFALARALEAARQGGTQ